MLQRAFAHEHLHHGNRERLLDLVAASAVLELSTSAL
jgi:hypothetical protein